MTAEYLALSVWGFATGFVCWDSCFRCVVPLKNWLLNNRVSGVANVIGGFLVLFFLICLVILLISLMTVVINASSELHTEQVGSWKNMFGISFIASIAGFFLLGFFRKISKTK